jgi:hypothetical protein
LEVLVRKKWVVWQTLGLSVALLLVASFFSPVWAADDLGEPIQMSTENSVLRRQGDDLFITLGKNTYSIPNATTDEKALDNFHHMSPLQQQRFYQNRDMFIANAAKVLRRVGWTFGIGSLVANKIVMVKNKTLAPFRSDEANVLKATDPTSESFKARSQRVITSILSSLNRQLWSQAPLVGDANEFGLNLSIGLALEGGHAKKGWGGQFEIGFNFGYNKESKAFVFQIYRNIEKFKTTLMPAIFYTGVTPKAAIQVAQVKDGSIQSRVGTTVYPPGVPVFLSTTPTMFASGLNSGIGFPPPPFGDVLSYTNTLDNKALIRITVSPLLKGFVRVQFGVGLKSLTVFLQPITIMKSWLLSLFGSGLCRGVFVN